MGAATPDANPRRFVIGTAGHIDHGKTALVKALTGVDTDRWEEEKRRGITIDLGFAPLSLGGSVETSIVDVPGHEGFIRNMLAGATGIDVALLVVAADEGIMPQTEEHLAILELLGISRGVPVITKRDLADPELLEVVRAELVERLQSSRVSWTPPIAVSALRGEGLDELRAALQRLASGLTERPMDDLFRLPIDRVFSLPGAGTVVTGSTWSGSVSVGDAVRLLPLDRTVRVRSVQAHSQVADAALPGRRTALALVGVDRAELARGDVVVNGTGWTSTRVLDAVVELLPTARRPLVPRTRVRLHLGTAEVLGRVVQLEPIAPGKSGLARLSLEGPVVARGNDRFVLRSFSPVTTIGGGVILDPAPPIPGARLTQRGLSAMDDPKARLERWTVEARLGGLPVASLAVRLGLSPARVSEVMATAAPAIVTFGERLVARSEVAAAITRLAGELQEHHRRHPLEPGLSLEAWRASVGTGTRVGAEVAEEVVEGVLAAGRSAGVWETEEGVIRITGWRPAVDPKSEAIRQRLLEILREARWELPTIAELQRDLGPAVRPMLALLSRAGTIEQVDQERFADREALRAFQDALELALQEMKTATPAELRDRFKLTRKFLIPLLEWADRRGITRRQGDARTLVRLTARSENR